MVSLRAACAFLFQYGGKTINFLIGVCFLQNRVI